jgi:cold-inducible RNA-binding protein
LSTNIYVGNIPYDSTAEDLHDWFSDFGTVTDARIAVDRVTGRSRGFGFVEMADGAENAIDALNGFRLDGRPLVVNEDRPRPRLRAPALVGAGPARRGGR